jgi:hypothetical protein
VKVAPPPIQPISPPPDLEVVPDDPDDTGELDLTDLQSPIADTGGVPDAAVEDGPARRRAMKYRKQTLQLYLSAPTRARLDKAREVHGTYGEAAMAALRGAYQWLVDNHSPEPVEAIGPFPAPTPTRRRLAVDDARVQQILITPDEAAAIEALADQLELNLSELTTLAIDHWYGEDAAMPRGTGPAARPKRQG